MGIHAVVTQDENELIPLHSIISIKRQSDKENHKVVVKTSDARTHYFDVKDQDDQDELFKSFMSLYDVFYTNKNKRHLNDFDGLRAC